MHWYSLSAHCYVVVPFPTKLLMYSFCCWFSINSVIIFLEGFLEGCFPNSVVAEVIISFSVLLFRRSIFYSFFRRHYDVALFTHHLELLGSCSFLAYPFNRSVVSSLQVLFILSSFPSSFSRSAAQIISILFLLYLVLTGVVSISILSLDLQVLVMFLVPLF